MATLDITLIPALSDNYIHLVRCPVTGTVAVVDPAEADPVIEAVEAAGGTLDLILNTHHHHDHIGGNAALKARYGARIVGPAAETTRIPDMDHTVGDGDAVQIGAVGGQVIAVPGHTTGHIAFYFADAGALFAGDALFALGCGRMFEGEPKSMWRGLTRLRALPDTTALYCGHEYTAANARFARSVDPDNPDLAAYADEIAELRQADRPTLPASLGREKRTNPFLRADDPALAAAMGKTGGDPADVFAALRSAKDRF